MDSMKLVVVIITIVFAIIKASNSSKTNKKPIKPSVGNPLNNVKPKEQMYDQQKNQKPEQMYKPNARPTETKRYGGNSGIPVPEKAAYKAPEQKVKKQEEHKQEEHKQEVLMNEIQDLMIKGYDGRLTYSRDFVSEGIDMLNRIQLKSEV